MYRFLETAAENVKHDMSHRDAMDLAAVTLEDILVQSVYLILKYSKNENALEEALKANKQIAGAQEAREMAIEMILG